MAGAQPDGAAAVADEFNRQLPMWWFLAPLCSIIALGSAAFFYRSMMKEAEGSPRMKEIASYVREGAYAYLRRQYLVVGIFFVVVFVLLLFMAIGLNVQHYLVPFAFMPSGFFSGLAGFFGMKTATSAASRTAHAASQSLNKGLRVAFRSGAVMGLTVVGLALLDNSIWFLYLYKFHHTIFGGEPMTMETITMVMICFGMGASSQALFARVGGGIYTKAADVGADLVGKVEAGIPEDDPRNPATIADNVGDNVGDVAGMGADLYESYAGAILAAAALGVAAASTQGLSSEVMFNYMVAPAILAAVGILASVVGILVVRANEDATMTTLLHALDRGIYLASALIVVAAVGVVMILGLPWSILWSIMIGLALGLVIGKGTEWATSAEYKPTQNIAEQSTTGPATLIIGGIAEGMLSTWIPILAVCLGMMSSFALAGGFTDLFMGLYGIGIAAVGMLSTLGITLATDAYGPISDNAGGIAEMADMPKEVRERTDMLDSLGNTTAAIGKGFAIGSAALTALALLASYVESIRVGIHREAAAAYTAPAPTGNDIFHVKDLGFGKFGVYIAGSSGSETENRLYTVSAIQTKSSHSVRLMVDEGPRAGEVLDLVIADLGHHARRMNLVDVEGNSLADNRASLDDFMIFYNVTLTNPKVLVGVFLGVLLVFVFSAMTMKAVGRAAAAMVNEVRRQFREKPGIMQGTETPDYARCVAISTAGAQKEMILPSFLALLVPIAVGLVLSVSGVMGMLVGTLCAGFAMAVYMANAGGAWDNAKKYIEAGHHGGKGSDSHKAAVVGDTVGDPFKDTSGPSLNILIKLTSIVSIVFAGLIVKFAPMIGQFLGIGY
ncbi:MAG: sodium-translocating pyrophosphatase [Candidatus Sumerlaeia bacterium]|nr:sodium-translocating pyrophosphatase [Candidatus Sumerlaeia bacterium]